MFCQRCGAKIPDEARFCEVCGAPTMGPPQSSRPQKRSAPRKQEIKPPPLAMRILLVLCSVIILCVSMGTVFVNFIGKNAEATILSTEINRQLPNEKYLYSWDVTYEFYVHGKRYVDTAQLTGPRGSINTFGYHVSYLAFAPEVSRLTRGSSVSTLNNLADMLQVSGGAVFIFILELLVSYFLLWVAFPRLPFFGFGGKKNRRSKPDRRGA